MSLRGRNWLALTLGTVVLMFSYFAYAAAFRSVEGQPTIDAQLVGIAVLIAPFVFVVVVLVPRNPRPKLVLWAMLLLVLIALPVGLLAPILGASAGFGVGIALVLAQPDVNNVLRRRILVCCLRSLTRSCCCSSPRPQESSPGPCFPPSW